MTTAEAVKNHGGEFGTDAASTADNDMCQALDVADKKLLVNIVAHTHTPERQVPCTCSCQESRSKEIP